MGVFSAAKGRDEIKVFQKLLPCFRVCACEREVSVWVGGIGWRLRS